MMQLKQMTRLDLIRLIGNVITELDVLSSDSEPGSADQKNLDNFRSKLDAFQLILVRKMFEDNTIEFKNLTSSLKEINEELQQTIDDIQNVAKTLEMLTKFVGVIQEIVKLVL